MQIVNKYVSLALSCTSVYSHAPHNNVLVNDRPHILWWSHNIIILTIVLQLPTVFSTVICRTGLWPRSNMLYYLGLCKYTMMFAQRNRITTHFSECIVKWRMIVYSFCSEDCSVCCPQSHISVTEVQLKLVLGFNLLTPNVNYSGHTVPLTSKVAFYIFIQQI